MESQNYDELLQHIQQNNFASSDLILIDGATGSGKTHLAMQLSKDLSGIRVSTDCYILPEIGGSYLNRLAFEFMSDDLTRLQKVMPMIIFEGICARDVMEKLNSNWNFSIYLKKIANSGLWHFEYNLEEFQNGNKMSEDNPEPFKSDYEYHGRIQPHLNSDFTFVRIDD